jgi:hypothetical protein
MMFMRFLLSMAMLFGSLPICHCTYETADQQHHSDSSDCEGEHGNSIDSIAPQHDSHHHGCICAKSETAPISLLQRSLELPVTDSYTTALLAIPRLQLHICRCAPFDMPESQLPLYLALKTLQI